jgi:hypothetical protein
MLSGIGVRSAADQPAPLIDADGALQPPDCSQRWSLDFGQLDKLGLPEKDGPDDGQADAVFG